MASTWHAKMRVWHTGCDSLMGLTAGPRPYCVGYKAKDGMLDEDNLVQFWGADLMSLEAKATDIIKQRGIRVKPNKNKPGFNVDGQ